MFQHRRLWQTLYKIGILGLQLFIRSPGSVASPCDCPSLWLAILNTYVVISYLSAHGQKNHEHFQSSWSLGRERGLNILLTRAATRMLRESGMWWKQNDKHCCHLTSGEPGSHLGLEKDTNECLILPGFWKMAFIFCGDYSKLHLEESLQW